MAAQNVRPISLSLATKYFKAIEKDLLDPLNRMEVLLTPWAKSHCDDAGVYALFVNDKLNYVGETGCLAKRMGDLLNTKNHCVRRSLGETLFSSVSGFEKATSSKSFPPHIEKRLGKMDA